MPCTLRIPSLLLLALALAVCVGCGDDPAPAPDNVGIQRYGAPAPGSIDYGEEAEAVEIGKADVVVQQPIADEPKTPTPKTPTAAPTPKSSGDYSVVAVADGGSIKGVVKFSKAPPQRIIDFNKDQKACGHDNQPSLRLLHDPKTLGVQNCFVYLADITKGKDWTGEMAKGEDDRVAILDQKGCTYEPHILAVRQFTQIQIKNSDEAEHNVHMYRGGDKGTTQCNELSPAGSSRMPATTFLETDTVYSVKCDIHAWMNGYVWVMKHPYYAVTASDGTFEMKDVPPGTYTLVVWREGMEEKPQFGPGGVTGYDYGDPVEQSRSVTVEAGGVANEAFTLDPPEK